jgi:hypothetical protein
MTHDFDQKIKKETTNLQQDLVKQINNLSQNLNKQINALDNKLLDHLNNVKDRDIKLNNELTEINKEISSNHKHIEQAISTINEHIKTQEEIIMDMIHKFDEKHTKDTINLSTEVEKVRNEQDVLKISFTLNEKKLMEKIKGMVGEEIRNSVKSKEQEILMNLWIQELKEIIENFENLKKVRPREFTLQIDQIANTIETFKKKLLS